MDFPKTPLIFAVNKPPQMTSNDVVYYFKKNLSFEFGKIGHFGTLDPFASGLLLIGIQGAQKINDFIHELHPKTYYAKGFFGEKTISGDYTSEVVESRSIDTLWLNSELSDLEIAIKKKYLGEYWQKPHQISATKFQGKRLYDHAKNGVLIQKDKVKREIFDFRITKFEYPEIEFFVTVSSGTYVRSFFEDISEYLGGVGHLKQLERSAVGDLLLEKATNKDSWPTKNMNYFEISQLAYTVDQVLVLNRIELNSEKSKRFLQGVRFRSDQFEIVHNENKLSTDKYYWVYKHVTGELLGMGQLVSSELHALFTYQNSIL